MRNRKTLFSCPLSEMIIINYESRYTQYCIVIRRIIIVICYLDFGILIYEHFNDSFFILNHCIEILLNSIPTNIKFYIKITLILYLFLYIFSIFYNTNQFSTA